MVTAMPNEVEIKKAIMGMNLDAAVGPDGFNGHFYSHSWCIIKSDLIIAI